MALVNITNFGGLLPSASERALPPTAATAALNLHPATNEFRPTLAGAAVDTTLDVFNPRTIYRFQRLETGELNTDPTVGWMAYSRVTYHAPWPNNDNLTERTTVSDAEGEQPPRVIDNTGEDRLLGVPAPQKPVVTLNVGDYYTEDDRNDDIKRLRRRILRKIQEALVRAKVGATYTADATEGFLESGPETGTEPSPQRARVYRFDEEDGTMTDAYTGVDEDEVRWVVETRKGVWILADGTPAWMGTAGTVHYAINYHAYGIGYKLSTEESLTNALDAVEYVDTDQAEEIAGLVAEMFDPQAKPAQAVIKPLKEAVQKLEDAINKRAPGMKTADEVSAEQTELLETTAKEIWQWLYSNATLAPTSDI